MVYGQGTYDDQEFKEVFSRIYRENLWKHGSGSGSNEDFCRNYVNFLNEFIKVNNIKSVLDIGCGDWQFSKNIDFSNVNYLGIDVADSVIEANKKLYTKENIQFVCNKIENLEKQNVDLVLCKCVMQHLSFNEIFKILKSIENCKIWILTNDITDSSRENHDIFDGEYRQLDLRKNPFNLNGNLFYFFDQWKPSLVVNNSSDTIKYCENFSYSYWK